MSRPNNSSPPWRRILLTAAMLGIIVIAVGAATALLLQNEANRASLTRLDQKLDALTQKTDRLQQDLNSLATDTPAPTPSKAAPQATRQPAATPHQDQTGSDRYTHGDAKTNSHSSRHAGSSADPDRTRHLRPEPDNTEQAAGRA